MRNWLGSGGRVGFTVMTAVAAVIVDDEALARERIRTLLQREADVTVAAECANGTDAIAAIRDCAPSILFLDVQMPITGGFEVLSALPPDRRPPAVIFVTAYDSYAVQAFEANAIDYLLKPYTRDRFRTALQRARGRLLNPVSVNQQSVERLLNSIAKYTAGHERVAVKSKSGVEFVQTSAIDWLQADGNYAWLHVGSRVLRTRDLLSHLESRLADAGFIRIHRSIILNADRIARVENSSHGEYVIVLGNGTRLSSSRTYNEQIRQLLRI